MALVGIIGGAHCGQIDEVDGARSGPTPFDPRVTATTVAAAPSADASSQPQLTSAVARIRLPIALPATKPKPDVCNVVKPGQSGLDDPARVETCVVLSGWWGVGALMVPETQDSEKGWRVLRPLSFVRETNLSLGWPSWAALDTVLVDCGWFPDAQAANAPVTLSASDPLFLEHNATVYGWVRRASAITPATWEHFYQLLGHPNTFPFGNVLNEVYVEWEGR